MTRRSFAGAALLFALGAAALAFPQTRHSSASVDVPTLLGDLQTLSADDMYRLDKIEKLAKKIRDELKAY